MASIFDKKQEVLDVILTREGRELMAKGEFKPVYYEFYDADVVYEADNSETQNASKERIKDGLYDKPIPSIDQINDLGGTVTNDNTNLLKNPIGSYQVQSEYAPAWQISFNESPYLPDVFSTSQRDIFLTNLENEQTSSGSLKSVNTYEERIPQFNVNVNYKLYQYTEELAGGGNRARLYFDNRNEDLFVFLEELNVFEPAEAREFEIEVFEILEPNGASQDQYRLKRLYFDEENIDSPNSVEKYFNVLLDEEARFESNFKTKDIYSEIVADPEELCEPEQE
jgi:hypothetical protein